MDDPWQQIPVLTKHAPGRRPTDGWVDRVLVVAGIVFGVVPAVGVALILLYVLL